MAGYPWYPGAYQPMGMQYPPMQQTPMPGTQMSQANQQMMTPPTIHADIVQVDDVGAVERHPMAAGSTQMFMTKAEDVIVIRTMMANGEHSDAIYDKRPPAPPEPKLDPAQIVTWDKLEEYLGARAKAKKKGEEHGTV